MTVKGLNPVEWLILAAAESYRYKALIGFRMAHIATYEAACRVVAFTDHILSKTETENSHEPR